MKQIQGVWRSFMKIGYIFVLLKSFLLGQTLLKKFLFLHKCWKSPWGISVHVLFEKKTFVLFTYQRNWYTCEENGDKKEELPSPDV